MFNVSLILPRLRSMASKWAVPMHRFGQGIATEETRANRSYLTLVARQKIPCGPQTTAYRKLANVSIGS